MKKLTKEQAKILVEFEEESQRCGNYEMIFPKAKNVDKYKGFFEVPRANNLLVCKYLKEKRPQIGIRKHFKANY